MSVTVSTSARLSVIAPVCNSRATCADVMAEKRWSLARQVQRHRAMPATLWDGVQGVEQVRHDVEPAR